jgi:hypothetical protein
MVNANVETTSSKESYEVNSVTDGSESTVNTIDTDPKNTENVVDEVKTDATAVVKTATPTAAVPKTVTTTNDDSIVVTTKIKHDPNKIIELQPYQEEYYSPFTSLMLNNNNLSIIKKALVVYHNKISGGKKTIMNEDEDETEEDNVEYDETVGNVYLKSIIYTSNSHWTVWLNDIKISNNTNLDKDNEFVIKKIQPQEIVVLWTVTRGKWRVINQAQKIPFSSYSLNESKNRIEFEIILHPNQTFVSSENKVIDGKYKQSNIIEDLVEENSVDLIFDGENADLDILLNKT